MKLQKIIENFRSFSQMTNEDWSLAEILTAIFNNVVSLEFRQDTAELLDRDRIVLYSLVDFPAGPSYACEVHVLTVDDKLVGLATRWGKGDWHGQPLDLDNFKSVAGDLAAAAVRNDLDTLPDIDLDQNLDIHKHPIHFLDKAETMFVLKDPRSVYRLPDIPQRHRAYFVDEAGNAQRIERIGEFKQKTTWAAGRPLHDNQISIVVGGAEREADAGQLMFELIREQGDLDTALQAYHAPHSWTVAQTAPRVNRVILDIAVPNRWDSQRVWVEFKSTSAMHMFLSKYPEGTQVAGEFKVDVLGPDGFLYNIHQPVKASVS